MKDHIFELLSIKTIELLSIIKLSIIKSYFSFCKIFFDLMSGVLNPFPLLFSHFGEWNQIGKWSEFLSLTLP